MVERKKSDPKRASFGGTAAHLGSEVLCDAHLCRSQLLIVATRWHRARGDGGSTRIALEFPVADLPA